MLMGEYLQGYLFQTSIYFLKAPTFDEQTKEI